MNRAAHTTCLQGALSEPSKAQQDRAAEAETVWFTCVSLWFVDKVITWVGGGGHVLPLSGYQRVVLLPVVVGVEELLEPLHEFKVVLELPFYKLFYRNYLEDGNRKCFNSDFYD